MCSLLEPRKVIVASDHIRGNQNGDLSCERGAMTCGAVYQLLPFTQLQYEPTTAPSAAASMTPTLNAEHIEDEVLADLD